ncbi:MAG: VOC family protein [Acidobacteriaceae bacterium]
MPRFRQFSDEEILKAEFRLADAQELIARKEGFEGWQALRTGASTAMSQTHPHSQPILTSVAAHLYVRNLKASTDFFTTKLGFTIDFVYGDPPFYGQVSRDNARLALRHMDEPVFAGDIREREGLLSASITLASADEIRQLFVAYQAADVPLAQSMRNEPWGAKTFIVKDPDGNLILFAAPAS